MTTSLAAMSLIQYRERYPYGGAALRVMPEHKASREVRGRRMPSVGAAARAVDSVDQSILGFERNLVVDLGLWAGRDLRNVDVFHVFIDSPNAITLFDSNDRSYAIGVDPSFWRAICTLYWDAALCRRANDQRMFLIFATKTVGWFWVGSPTDSTDDYEGFVNFVQENTPDLWHFGRDLVNTAIAFTIAHEVAHIVLGHLEGPHATSLRLTDSGPVSLSSALDSEDEEIAADEWAAEALFSHWADNDTKKRALAVSVPALCFCLAAIKSEMVTPATNIFASATANSHPSDMARAQRLHTLARSHVADVPNSKGLKHLVELGFWVNEQRRLLQEEGMHWVPEYLRKKGLSSEDATIDISKFFNRELITGGIVNQASDGNVGAEDGFTLTVDCGTPDDPHSHHVTIGHARGIEGAAPPANVRMQYTCPASGMTKMMTFQPPRGAARPFEIRQIS